MGSLFESGPAFIDRARCDARVPILIGKGPTRQTGRPVTAINALPLCAALRAQVVDLVGELRSRGGSLAEAARVLVAEALCRGGGATGTAASCDNVTALVVALKAPA